MSYVCVHQGTAIYRKGDLYEVNGQRLSSLADARDFIDLTKAGKTSEANKLVVVRFG